MLFLYLFASTLVNGLITNFRTNFFTLLFVLLLSLERVAGSGTFSTNTSDYVWHDQVCFASETKCPISYLNLHNLSAATAYRMSLLCSSSSTSRQDVCQNPKSFERWYTYTQKRLRWGVKIQDPQYEWKIRQNRWIKRWDAHLFYPLIEKLLNASSQSKRILLFVQVGANVGATINDPIYPMLLLHPYARGVLMEPASAQYQALQYNYRAAFLQNRVSLENIAICSVAGIKEIVIATPPQQDNDSSDENVLHEAPSPMYDFLYRSYKAQMGRVDEGIIEGIDKDGDKGATDTNTNAATVAAAATTIEQQLSNTYDFGKDSLTMRENITCVSDLAPYVTPFYENIQHQNELPLAWVLVVDAEGSDLLVVKKALSFGKRYGKVQSLNEGKGDEKGDEKGETEGEESTLNTVVPLPTIILFESAHSGASNDFSKLMSLLDDRGYICELETMMDIVCVRDMQQLEDAPACCLLTTHCSQQCDGVRRELETVETVKDMDINVDGGDTSVIDEDRADLLLDIAVDGRTHNLILRLNMHPSNTAVEACISLKIQPWTECSERLTPMILKYWKKNYLL